MKKIEMRMLTTHVDKHGSRFSLEALETFVESVKKAYLPIIIEHDPRKPPIGRVISAHLVKLDDGEYAVDGEGELFDGSEIITREDDKREVVVERNMIDGFQLCIDEYFLNNDDKADITDIRNYLKITNNPTLEVKKAAEPLCILTIIGSFMLAHFLSGIFTEMGKDVYSSFKKTLAALMERKRKQLNVECLLKLHFRLMQESQAVDVVIILTNPDSSEINDVLDKQLTTMARYAQDVLSSTSDVRQIVFEYSEKQLLAKYAIRKDAIPLNMAIETILNSEDTDKRIR